MGNFIVNLMATLMSNWLDNLVGEWIINLMASLMATWMDNV